MIMLDSLFPLGKLGLIIRDTYFYVVNCSKQGLLMAKVSLLGENPLIPLERSKELWNG